MLSEIELPRLLAARRRAAERAPRRPRFVAILLPGGRLARHRGGAAGDVEEELVGLRLDRDALEEDGRPRVSASAARARRLGDRRSRSRSRPDASASARWPALWASAGRSRDDTIGVIVALDKRSSTPRFTDADLRLAADASPHARRRRRPLPACRARRRRRADRRRQEQERRRLWRASCTTRRGRR